MNQALLTQILYFHILKNKYLIFRMQNQETLNAPLTIAALVNGMIGGLFLLLPVYAITSGYVITLIVIILTGIFNFYFCYLSLIHLGDQPDLDTAIFKHFNGLRWIQIIYNFSVWLCLILYCILYYQLIILQWEGLLYPYEFSPINPIVNTVVLIILIFLLKYFDLGAKIMSYGIISIILYLICLIWIIASYSNEDNSQEYEAIGSKAVDLAAAMGAAFSIQTFFIPILKKNPEPKKYVLLTLIAYAFGFFAYFYIAFIGSVGILHRVYVGQVGNQKTIQGYFSSGNLKVSIIQSVFLIHLYSVFPEYLIISRKRMFELFNLTKSEKGQIKVTQLAYFIIILGICLLIRLFRVNIDYYIIQINGGIIGVFFIYFIPAALHLKCLYFSKGKKPPLNSSIILTQMNKTSHPLSLNNDQTKIIEEHSSFLPGKHWQQTLLTNQWHNVRPYNLTKMSEKNQNQEIESQSFQKRQKIQQKSQTDKERNIFDPETAIKQEEDKMEALPELLDERNYFYCNCELSNYSQLALVVDWIFIVMMVGLGAFVMVNTIYAVTQ